MKEFWKNLRDTLTFISLLAVCVVLTAILIIAFFMACYLMVTWSFSCVGLIFLGLVVVISILVAVYITIDDKRKEKSK